MSNRPYLIHFPNGFKQHVSRTELSSMSGLEPIGHKAYRAPAASIEQANGPAYLPGSFIIERDGKRETERLQTSKGQIQQLEAMGWKADVFAA